MLDCRSREIGRHSQQMKERKEKYLYLQDQPGLRFWCTRLPDQKVPGCSLGCSQASLYGIYLGGPGPGAGREQGKYWGKRHFTKVGKFAANTWLIINIIRRSG